MAPKRLSQTNREREPIDDGLLDFLVDIIKGLFENKATRGIAIGIIVILVLFFIFSAQQEPVTPSGTGTYSSGDSTYGTYESARTYDTEPTEPDLDFRRIGLIVSKEPDLNLLICHLDEQGSVRADSQ